MRAFSDERFTMTHLRVLGCLASHTDRNGWCRVKQAVLGNAIGIARQTVNARLGDLVEWSYVERHTSKCAGRSIFYRVLLDNPTADQAFDDGIDELLHAEALDGAIPETHNDIESSDQCRLRMTPATADTRCRVHELTPAVRYSDDSDKTLALTASSTPSPPTPANGGGSGRGFANRSGLVKGQPHHDASRAPSEIDALLAAVATTPDRARAVEEVIGPIVRTRTLTAPDPVFALGTVADFVAKHSPSASDAAAIVDAVRSARRATVKPADIEDAVRAQIAAKNAGNAEGRVALSPSDPECAAWLAYAEPLAKIDPSLAKIASMLGKGFGAIVPSRWPPGACATDEIKRDRSASPDQRWASGSIGGPAS